MRVLIAVEERYRIHGDALGAAVEALRPHLQVVVAELKDLESLMSLLEPEVVICSRSTPTEPATSALAWVELSVEPDRPTRVRVGKRCWDISNPTLQEVLAIIQSAEALAEARTDINSH